MARLFLSFCQLAFTVLIISSPRNHGSSLNTGLPISVTVHGKICKIIRECKAVTIKQGFLRHLFMKATGLPDVVIPQLCTENYYTTVTTAYPRTTESPIRGHTCQLNETMKKTMDSNCKQHGYRAAHAGRDKIFVKLHRQKHTWNGAMDICCYEGGMLAVPNTKGKEESMMKIYRRNKASVWIGMRDAGQNHTFVWMDGSPLIYTNWGQDGPTNTGRKRGEECVQLQTKVKIFSPKYYRWDDVPCERNASFICECL